MKAERPILAQENTFKIDLSIWQLLGLERTLLSELPRGIVLCSVRAVKRYKFQSQLRDIWC